jgi:hypothetical protein
MKKALIAVVLASLAGTATAQNIKIDAVIKSGTEPARSYSVVVPDGQAIEILDKQQMQYLESTPVVDVKTGVATDDPQSKLSDLDLGLSLKVTPRLLSGGNVLLDTAFQSVTLEEMKKERVNGVFTESPLTREVSFTSQQITDFGTPVSSGALNVSRGKYQVSLAATKI